MHGDAEALPFADGAFDVVIGAFVINHLPRPERGVAEMRRVARRRLSLAMWAEDTAMFALVDGPSDAPPGPDAEHFARREHLLQLLPGEVTEVRFELDVESFDALHDGLAGGTVRTAARLAHMPREALRRPPSRTAAATATRCRPSSASSPPPSPSTERSRRRARHPLRRMTTAPTYRVLSLTSCLKSETASPTGSSVGCLSCTDFWLALPTSS